MHVSRSLFAVVAAGTLVTSVVQAQPKPNDLDSAEQLLKAGKPDQALALVDPIIAQAKDAKDPKAICPSVAVAALQAFMKNPDVVVSVEDDWCDALLIKGYALNELKRSAEAETVLASLVGHDPNNTHYLIEYAYTVRFNGQPERSLELYKKAERLASKLQDGGTAAHWRAAALRGQGYAYTDLQRWDDAVKAYQQSQKFEPDSDIAKHELQYIAEHRPH